MKSRVAFRSFEERDIDFIYKTKNSAKVNKLTVAGTKSFSYEDAVKWVEGCMKESSDYKYWAICTNDEFQNIVGWCGISNIDYVNKKAVFRGITIANPKYNDGVAWYETYYHVTEYVLITMGFNRLYSLTLTDHVATLMFNSLVVNSKEGILKQAVFRNGKYCDLVINAVLREEYIQYKEKGLLNYDSYMAKFKETLVHDVNVIQNLDDFLSMVALLLTETPVSELNKETRFKAITEWSSLFAIELVGNIEASFKVKMSPDIIAVSDTLEDLYKAVLSLKSEGETNDFSWESIDDITEPYLGKSL